VAVRRQRVNIDERNIIDKTGANSLDLQAVTLTKVAGMHSSIVLPILMELILIISYLLILTQQYLTFLLIVMLLLWLAMLLYITVIMNLKSVQVNQKVNTHLSK
jgi:hypothetical protein